MGRPGTFTKNDSRSGRPTKGSKLTHKATPAQLFAAMFPDALQVLQDASAKDAPWTARMDAAKTIIERHLGKIPQPIELPPEPQQIHVEVKLVRASEKE